MNLWRMVREFPERVPKSWREKPKSTRQSSSRRTGILVTRVTHGSRSIHDDETELGIGVEELGKSLGLELVVASVEGAER